MMNSTNYKQYDTRWAKLGYPKSPYFIKDCGCGEVSICNCIIEMEKYSNQTPKTIQPYCKQFAAPNGNGTYFTGIPKMMAHYGMTEVKEHQTMAELWKELAKGDRVAIYLMGNRKGGSKGVHWTSSAHFVCSVGYKVKDGKHYVYVKDSNSTSSLRNGWIAYEDNMRGDVSRVWSGKLSGKKSDGKLTVDGIGGLATVNRLQEFLGVSQTDGITIRKDLQKYVPSLTAYEYGNGSPTVKAMQKWLGLSDPDGLWGANTSKALQLKVGFPKAECDGIFGPNSMKALQKYLNANSKATYPKATTSKASKIASLAKSYCGSKTKETAAYKAAAKSVYGSGNDTYCHRFVGTVLAKAGYPKMDYSGKTADAWKKIMAYLKKNFKQVTGTPKAGDIHVIKSAKGAYHIFIELGGGKKAEANSKKKYYPHIAKTSNGAKNWLFRAK